MNADAPQRRKNSINNLKRKIGSNEQKWKDWLGLCDEDDDF